MSDSPRNPKRWDRLARCLVIVLATGLALTVARPYAGGWNDGSRLATVETLVDQQTWKIDQSTFVQVPPRRDSATPLPYDPSEPGLLQSGTLDKLFIAAHYYSDKSPVPALLMAGGYQLWQWATGWSAGTHPDRFCRAMTWISSGLAYIAAVLCIYQLGRSLRLALSLRLLLTASFALATVALPYTQQVNNHILLLALTSALAWMWARTSERMNQGLTAWRHVLGLGFVAGLGYTIDLGAGPVILLCTAVLVLIGSRPASAEAEQPRISQRLRIADCGLFVAGALPWLVLHHVLNYAIGGSIRPANANPDYFCWPGSPFDAHNLTGRWIHSGVGSFLLYAASMLAGKRGFLGHNLPLFLVLPAAVLLLRRHRETWREVGWAIGCGGGVWLLYAATSNNSSGQCLSIRWFVPLLAPSYYILALFLKRYPQYRIDFLVLSVWGALLALLMYEGPWIHHMVPLFWPIQAAALLSWAGCAYRRRQTSLVPCSAYATSVY